VTSGQGGTRWARGGSRTCQQRGRPRRQLDRPAPGRQPHRPARRQPHSLTERLSRCAAVVLALATAMALAGCGQAGQGAPIAPRTMSVSSEAFSQYILPKRYTCHGDGIHPPLDWSGAPTDTKSLAVVVDDSSAPITPYIYWLVFNIQPGTTDIQEGALPTGARQALNSAGTMTYDAPCPSGHSHSYRFTVYALNRDVTLPNGAPLLAVWTAIADATIGRGRIVVTGYP
jgi:Raf kinase inhibitor-like YbhB/YbcL family protein